MDPGVQERGSEDSGHVGARMQVTGFSTLCHLHMVIDLIHTFDKERENWTRFKRWPVHAHGEKHGKDFVQRHMRSET